MNHLIIYSHVRPESFSGAILDVVVAESQKKGVAVQVRDLNAMNFNPVLSAEDLVGIRDGNTPADIKVEQDWVEWADVISFIHPLWWTQMPAIIKGYIDRIFSFGFAYTYTENGPKGLLPHKRVMAFTPMGTPYDIYLSMGMIKALDLTTDTGIFHFCGMTDVAHLRFGAVPTTSDEERKRMLEEVRTLVRGKLVAEKVPTT